MPSLWLVRLGKFGDQENRALETGELATGWIINDLTPARTREQILPFLEKANPQGKAGTLQNWAVQLNQFRNEIADGDLVVTPLKTTGQIAIGQVLGGYVHTKDNRPGRIVKWLRTDVPRDAIKQDLLFSLGASQTICEISRNDAFSRFQAVIKNGIDPGMSSSSERTDAPVAPIADTEAETVAVDFALNARDQIERRIASQFTGHGFTQLISEILRAQGYQTRVSPPWK
ncbi:MAG: restriction system protein [Variibacter sp.]|nr:restriction system protein [Variibacter sp.]